MSVKVAINGFGRIGRSFFRKASGRNDYQIVAINDLAPTHVLAHLLKYDSAHGKYPGEVKAKGDLLIVDGHSIAVTHFAQPLDIDWKAHDVWGVLEATGCCKTIAQLQGHLTGGASKVVLSANPKEGQKNSVKTLVMGLNEREYKPRTHHLLSNASCTTNCLAPILAVIDETFGISQAIFTTIHSYTGDQRLIDGPHLDLHRARAAACNIVPTTTGANEGVDALFPNLCGRIDGLSVRVPTQDVSLIDLNFVLKHSVEAGQVNELVYRAAKKRWKPYLEYNEEPIVSSDVRGSCASTIFDATQTKVVGGKGRMLKTMLWYDNETGYAARLVDLFTYLIKKEQ